MSISIQKCTVEDAEEMITVGGKAFENDELLLHIFNLKTATAEQREQYQAWRMAVVKQRFIGEEKFYYKAVDESSGKLVGYVAMYGPNVSIADNHAPESIQKPTFINVKADDEFKATLREMEAKHIGERKDVWYVQSMLVHPDHQGRGIGTKLLRRGLEDVDNAGQDVFLEASPAGAKLYESCGFNLLEMCTVIDDSYEVGIMMRPAIGKV